MKVSHTHLGVRPRKRGGGLSVVPLSLHCFTSFRNGSAATPIPNAKPRPWSGENGSQTSATYHTAFLLPSIPNALFIVIALIALFTFTSFSSPRRTAVELPAPAAEIDPQNPNIIRRGGIEYSASTVIVSVAESATDAHIADLASRHELEIVYNMQNLHIVVLRTAEPQSPEALDALIAALQAEPLVLTVEKDHIIRLDDPVENPRLRLRNDLQTQAQ